MIYVILCIFCYYCHIYITDTKFYNGVNILELYEILLTCLPASLKMLDNLPKRLIDWLILKVTYITFEIVRPYI